EKNGGCDRDMRSSKSRRSPDSRSFGSFFGLRVLNHFRRFGIPKIVAIKIYQKNRDAVLYRAFSQIMQIWSPASRLGQILRDSLGQEDVAAISTIHHPAGQIDSSPCDVCSIVYVANFVDWPAVNAHPKLQLRIFF